MSQPGNETATKLRLPIAALKADPKNPRRISSEAAHGLAVSLETFGPLDIVFNDETGELVGGHQRVSALRAAGATEVVRVGDTGYIVHPKTGERFPVRFVKWDATKQRMANLVANNPYLQGDFTEDAIAQARSLEDEAHFHELQLDKLIAAEEAKLGEQEPAGGNCDPDDVPEPPAEPISKRGDLWILGDHRLLCGDSTSAEDVARLLGEEKPHLMVTDPPYGVEYDADWRNHAFRADGSPSDGRAIGKVANDDRCDWSAAWAMFPGSVAYVWHAFQHAGELQTSLFLHEFEVRWQIIWAKSNFAIGRGDYHPKHECCWYVVKKGCTSHYNGDRTQTTLWEIDKPQKSETGHSTQKPIECMAKPIVNNSNRGESVYEPFSGSGTTIIAAEMHGRRCFAMELSPQYVDVAVARWEKFTNKKAIKEDP